MPRARAADPEAVLVALGTGVPSEELPGLSDTNRRLLRRGSEEAQADDVRALVLFARSAGCKGVASYRGGPGCSPCALPERTGEWI